MKQKEYQADRIQKVYDNTTYLVNPSRDCGEKQLFMNNGYKNPMDNLVKFLKNGDRITFKNMTNVHKPDKLGQYTKDNFGYDFKSIQQANPKVFNQPVNNLLPRDKVPNYSNKVLKKVEAF